MSSGLNVPLGVSESLVGELQRIQDQILVLADNHEVSPEGDAAAAAVVVVMSS